MIRRCTIVLAALVLVLASCGTDSTELVDTNDTQGDEVASVAFEFTGDEINTYVANPGDFAGKSAADWDTAEVVEILLDEMSFTPNELTFEAGKPYKVELVNVGAVKHEFAASNFFASVAWRKVESAQSEIKAPFFTEIEVFAGEKVELFFVPITPGTYDIVCEIEGHLEAGMFGKFTVTGSAPTSPAPVLTAIADGDWVTNGSDLVGSADWDTMETIDIEMGEFFFKPNEVRLIQGQPYRLVFNNTMAEVKHEATSPGLFATIAFRKAQDASGEYKAPTVAEVETFAGEETELFLIPQETGTFDLVCEIEGHFEAGMFGTVVVDPA